MRFAYDHLSCHLHLRHCHLMHNLHSLQKVVHRRNGETIRRTIPRTPFWRKERRQKRIWSIYVWPLSSNAVERKSLEYLLTLLPQIIYHPLGEPKENYTWSLVRKRDFFLIPDSWKSKGKMFNCLVSFPCQGNPCLWECLAKNRCPTMQDHWNQTSNEMAYSIQPQNLPT